jgi:hypothetical protein
MLIIRSVMLLSVLSMALGAQALPPHLLIMPNEPGSIQGKLIDGITGSPLPGTQVFAAPVDVGGDPRGIAARVTAADGSFRFDQNREFLKFRRSV